jgi:beta-glucosidase
VKQWTTFNEPWSFAIGGYAMGTLAPGRGASESMRIDMKDFFPGARATPKNPWTLAPTEGNPRTEPYIVAHNQLLAHAAAVKLYKSKYKGHQRGVIGITLVTNWEVPYSQTRDDKDAAQRALDFMFGWFMDPIATGDYPDSMKKYVGNRRLPTFTDQESKDLKGSYDYLGVNYYTANYARNDPNSASDSKVKCTTARNGVPIGEQAGSDWLYVYPVGIFELLNYIKNKYNNPIVYITENGRDELNEKDQSLWVSLFDFKRISYHASHLDYIKKAIDNGANVKGYYVWSLMDNLEWSSGFKSRFGINFINFKANVERYPKLSAAWFKMVLQKDPKKA